MAHSVSLATYSVRVRPKGEPGNYEMLGELDDGAEFLGVAARALKSLKKEHHKDDVGRSVLRVQEVHENDYSVWGLLASGDYGYEATGVSSETFERSYLRSPDDAEVIPFYFYLELPADKSIGFLVVQRFGAYGVYDALRSALRDYFGSVLPGHEVEFARLVPKGLIEDYLAGDLTKITIRWYEVPSDVAERYKLGGNRRMEAEFHAVIRAKRGKVLEEPVWVSKWRTSRSTIVELPFDQGEQSASVILGYSVNGKQRALNPLKLEAMAPYYDVTSDIVIGTGGHPTFKSLHSVASNYCIELRNKLGIASDA